MCNNIEHNFIRGHLQHVPLKLEKCYYATLIERLQIHFVGHNTQYPHNTEGQEADLFYHAHIAKVSRRLMTQFIIKSNVMIVSMKNG